MEKRYIVLIVDDAQSNIDLMSDMLADSYDIITANNGVDAIGIMRGENRPDVVLLDMLMPKPDGYDVLRIMSEDEELRSIPVVVITSDNDPNARTRSYELGAVDFVSRGQDMSFIRYRVRSVLRLCEIDKMRRENERLKGEITSKQQLGALMDNLPGGVAIIRTNGIKAECTYYNSKLLDLFGMNSDGFVMQFAMPVHPKWLDEFMERAKSSDSFTFEFTVGDNVSPDLRQWIRVTAGGIGEKDGMNEMYCVFLDINAEKRQELRAEESSKQLREKQSQLETVVNNAPGGITLSELGDDGHFKTLFISRGLVDMLGYSSYDECLADISRYYGIGVSESDIAQMRKMIAELPESGGNFKYAFTCRSRTNHELWLTMRCHLTHGENGRMQLYAFVTNITKEKRFENELRTAAYFDPLTGLFNRHAFVKNARRVLDENPLTEFSLMRLNIGSFKVVNDLLGRDVGDKVLTVISAAIREMFTDRGIYARFFADNFIILTPYSERGIHPQSVLDAVQSAVAKSGLLSHEIQYYIGVYRITDRTMSIENMTDRAAIACRSINGSYQEHIAYYDEKMRLALLEEQEVCDESRRALQNGEFCVFYQPVYGIKAKRFVSAEALVRWNHPTKGMINPGKFVPVFEKNGFIAELDLYVLEQVCKYMKRRRDAGLAQFPISVNISRMSLYDPKLYDTISAITDRYEIDPRYFRIEITESAYNDNPAQLLETVGKLRDKCYPVLMDDFGSGYSSLNTLKDIPIDILKLDMKFMQGFEKNGKVGTIVTAVSRMSKWLNIPMLAEGVETKEQFDFLSSVGCAYIQGFYFSRPVPEEEFSRLIELDEVSGDSSVIENYALGDEVNELLGSNALVSKLISGAFGGFGIYELYDDKLEVIRVNEGYMQIMGYTPEDFNEDHINIWDMMNPDDAEISRQACLEALRTDKAVRVVVRRYDKNGKMLYLDGVHRKLGSTKDNAIICIAFNDITDQLASEQQIARSRTEIEEILSATDSVITDLDIESNSMFCVGDLSDYGIDITNISDPDNRNEELGDIVHPDDRAAADRFSRIRQAGKYSEEMRILNTKDGRYYWWKFTTVHSVNDAGKLVRTIGIANNIDAEKRAKLELEEERARVDNAMNRLGAGILTVEVSDDHKAHIIYSNDSFWNIIGIEKTDDVGFFNKIYSGVDAEGLHRIEEAVRSGGRENIIYRTTRSDGKIATLDLTVGLSHASEQSRVYMIILTDVTEQYSDRLKFEAIVRNFHEGLALVRVSEDGIEIEYATDKFYNVLDVTPENSKRAEPLLGSVIHSGIQTGDVRIKHGSVSRTVRLRVDKVDSPGVGITNYIVAASDVTLARAEFKNRIAERTANADAGLYDEVAEIDYKAFTIKLTYYRREPQRALNAQPRPLDKTLNDWGKKYVAPEDYAAFNNFITAPLYNPDFTDSYCVTSVLDAEGDGEYHKLGIVLVRSQGDVCMMYIRDRARVDDSVTVAQVAETYRLYKLVAEQTHTTVIEIDHVEKKTTCSPSISEYYTGDLSYSDVANDETSKQGPIIHPDDLKKYTEFVGNVYNSDKPQSVTVRMKMSDGTFKWNRLTISVVRGKDGRVLTSLSTINLVHNEMIAKAKARRTDELLRRIVSHIPMGVGVYKFENMNLETLYVSDYINTIFEGEQAARQNYYLSAKTFIENNPTVGKKLEGSRITQLKRAGGNAFWVNSRYNIVNEDDGTMVYVAISDVTEQVEAQRRETAREQTYKLLLSGTGTMVFDYDVNIDKFTYLIHAGESDTQVIENISENIEMFSMVPPDDRKVFLGTLLKLAKTAGEEEIIVHVTIGEYPRRYKVLYKSVTDEEGGIYRVVGKVEDVEDEVTRLESMQAKAMYDTLCVDIYNKQTTEELVRAELERSTSGVLMMIDVDDFKSINDTLGHMFGDEFLKKFASTVKKEFRETDIVGRYGGDEFFVFMPHATAALAEKKASKLLESIFEIEVPLKDGIKSSIGIASVSPTNREYRRLLKQADSALYQAKNRGKNCVVVYDSASMGEGSYRTKEAVERGRTKVALSSNPNSAASISMRVFSALYSSANVTDGINQMLSLVGKTFDVSRAYIFEDTEDGLYCCNTFEWCADGVAPEKDTLQKVSYDEDLGGNYRDNMGDDGIFYCHDINELGDAQREILSRQGIKSVLQCAIFDNGSYKGFVGFDECRNNRFWTQDQIDSLAFISKVLSIFLMMYRTRTVAENYAKSIMSILDDLPQILYIVDGETFELLYYNKMTEQHFGAEKIGCRCADEICRGDPRGICPIKRLRESGDGSPIEMFSPILNKQIKLRAAEIQWNGKPAYIVNCMLPDE
ncbi:MAG: EAL domain-containing protein [Oscillospiraceae bacterium]|nr:EAL domain-containing protein [Oscillospiraceae bacterium]